MPKQKQVTTMDSPLHKICLLLLLYTTRSSNGLYSWHSDVSLDDKTGGYNDIAVSIEDGNNNCSSSIKHIQEVITAASTHLYSSLGGKVYLASFNIRGPDSWTASSCGLDSISSHQPQTNRDIVVGSGFKLGKGPWTRQTLGCHKRGDFIYIPNIENDVEELGRRVAQEWLRFRYGVHNEDMCMGQTATDIVSKHPDLEPKGILVQRTWRPPTFRVSRQEAVRYILVLENSQAMHNQWQLLRTALKKWILHDLPPNANLGLVLFNEAAAHISATLRPLNKSRRDIAVNIHSRFKLRPQTGTSCVRCGLVKAIEALQTSSSTNTAGATIVLVGQGHSTVISKPEERDLLALARKHDLRLFTLGLLKSSHNEASTSLERLAFSTGGLSSFFTTTNANGLETYVQMTDALREVEARSSNYGGGGSVLLHENVISASFSEEEHVGSFVVDEWTSGANTHFNAFALVGSHSDNGFIKAMAVKDMRGNQYSGVTDYLANYHVFSVYNVPFYENKGKNWTYVVQTIPAPLHNNNYVVQVTSSSSNHNNDNKMTVKFFTNLVSHSCMVNATSPVKLFAEVMVNGAPVSGARVIAHISVISHATGRPEEPFQTVLVDNGTGDPDVEANDGVYSRYLTHFKYGSGRYNVELTVDDNGGTSSYLNSTNSNYTVLSPFKRIVKGDSFRIMSISSQRTFPPARILDLNARPNNSSRIVDLTFTAPGQDFDAGGPIDSYQVFWASSPENLYKDFLPFNVFNSSQQPGQTESFSVDFIQKNIRDNRVSIGVSGVDKDGNVATISNIRTVILPPSKSEANKGQNSRFLDDTEKKKEESFLDKSDKAVVIYILGASLAFILVCVLVLILILNKYKKKNGEDNVSVESDEEMPVHFDDVDFVTFVTTEEGENFPPPLPPPQLITNATLNHFSSPNRWKQNDYSCYQNDGYYSTPPKKNNVVTRGYNQFETSSPWWGGQPKRDLSNEMKTYEHLVCPPTCHSAASTTSTTSKESKETASEECSSCCREEENKTPTIMRLSPYLDFEPSVTVPVPEKEIEVSTSDYVTTTTHNLTVSPTKRTITQV